MCTFAKTTDLASELSSLLKAYNTALKAGDPEAKLKIMRQFSSMTFAALALPANVDPSQSASTGADDAVKLFIVQQHVKLVSAFIAYAWYWLEENREDWDEWVDAEIESLSAKRDLASQIVLSS